MAHKRANGEGSIYKRKSDNRWTGKLQVGFKPDGSPKYKVVYGNSQGEVKDKLEKLKGNIQNNTFVDTNKITFGQWLYNWLNVTIKATVKDTTWLIYKNLIEKHITPELGGVRLQLLRTRDIQKLYNKKMKSGRCDGKEGGLSSKTIKHMHQVIRGALDQAVKEGFISNNVADAAKTPKLVIKEMKTFTIEQVREFLEFTKNNKRYNRYYAAYFLEVYTGLRRGEILGLRNKDIDFEKKTITVVQQLVKVGSKNYLRELKTESSQNRVIAVPDEVIKVLKEHQKNKTEEYKLLGYDDIKIKHEMKEGLVFTNELGYIIQPRNFVRNFKAALKAAGLPDLRFHDMRHTFVVLSLQQGVDIKTIQSDLGHKEISTTLDRYGHVNNEMKREAAEKRSGLIEIKEEDRSLMYG